MGESVIGTRFRAKQLEFVEVDIGLERDVKDVIRTTKPDIVYIAGAMTNVDGCELAPSSSYEINVKGVKYVVDACRAATDDIGLVFISTDYVFDGEHGPYGTDAIPGPIQTYGRHKLLAEHYVALHAPYSLIVRTTTVYGTEVQEKNYVYQILRYLKAGTLQAIRDQWTTPTYAPDLANEVIRYASHLPGTQLGVRHVAGPDHMPKSHFASVIAEVWGFDTKKIIPTPTDQLGQPAKRPLWGGLKSSTTPKRSVNLGLEAMKEEMGS